MEPMPEEFLSRLCARLPHSQPKLAVFPSGAFMIDLTIKQEMHVIEYLPSLGFGVSRAATAVYGWEGVENAFTTTAEVEAYVTELAEGSSKKQESSQTKR
ncbi:hypothetical protein CMV30_04685 [Nibricoccus aquaticus]|uniref:Uncharacterized protein n=2 Tax=Nibricoccus aquaticus TaxID=2576891 RepID=A0A290Q4U3_9BACT|nr:hypothetical protein CMV30_04685 [Nibricoccus aquaticus]